MSSVSVHEGSGLTHPGGPDTTASALINTPVGPLTAVATARGLALLEFGHRVIDVTDAEGTLDPRAVLEQTRAELAAYFAGESRPFTVPLDLHGTPFQLAVWHALLRIPCGQTRSYADIARAIGKPAAVRAVGLANGANHIAIVIPCHRVIGADGRLTGYGGGLDHKRWLLEHEGAFAAAPLFA